MTANRPTTETIVGNLLAELFDGARPGWSWVLNPDDRGLLAVLESLPAEVASERPMPGRNTIVAHTNHLRYSLELLNRWARGEENPFAEADWEGSWKVQTVSEDEWRELQSQLRQEADAWREAVGQPREWDEISLTGAVASAAHVAYHLGAIRQLVAAHGEL